MFVFQGSCNFKVSAVIYSSSHHYKSLGSVLFTIITSEFLFFLFYHIKLIKSNLICSTLTSNIKWKNTEAISELTHHITAGGKTKTPKASQILHTNKTMTEIQKSITHCSCRRKSTFSGEICPVTGWRNAVALWLWLKRHKEERGETKLATLVGL